MVGLVLAGGASVVRRQCDPYLAPLERVGVHVWVYTCGSLRSPALLVARVRSWSGDQPPPSCDTRRRRLYFVGAAGSLKQERSANSVAVAPLYVYYTLTNRACVRARAMDRLGPYSHLRVTNL
ncbi:hypothetical protein MRX96_025284 [Rhipicephalus microplus]